MGGARRLLRGHYNPVNWTRKYPNLQYARVKGVRMLICTNCIKTLVKAPVVKKSAKKAAPAKKA